ncbi:hypothetical protein [Novosphingobium sp. Gsoil 351]|uniref:hypothetical protein n=1 Tax=Novosphingobium sp. Gsoil 351 TaxID=2675225 RepID=UPI0012B4791D|nr:hypothetical protein [Novosphingobium sp. Gsoil 351]QGN55601.1 hypothetical protein GKE62_14640 [Novosphingobium sp. Gsoil 351]
MSRSLALMRPAQPNAFRTRLRFLALKRQIRQSTGLTMQDARDFGMAYCACFLAVSAFIA